MLADVPIASLALLVVAAVGAGAINTLVGSGTLLTFPALLAAGLPPVTANVTNNVGLVFGSVAGTWGYRRELAGQGRRLAWLLPFSAVGGLTGAGLLLVLPQRVFDTAVPVLVGMGVLLVLAQPRLAARAARAAAAREAAGGGGSWRPVSGAATVGLLAGVAAAGVYGGYFGAAQGVILIGLLGATLADGLQRLNATKNALASAVNLLATVLFVVAAPDLVDWRLAATVAVGAVVGGVLGARYGRRLPARALRAVIAVVGVVAVIALAVR
ncbi:MAG: sulfite exporter TauE/SafE family protein [Kineosporiaceae bacterium]